MRQQTWNVFKPQPDSVDRFGNCHRYRLLDTVFFDPSMDAEDVKRALVDHDGLPTDIFVKKEA